MAEEDEGPLERPPRLGMVGAALAVVALMGASVAATLAWRNQLDTVATSASMVELQERWTVAQQRLRDTTEELLSTTAELEALRAERAAAEARTDAEIAGLRDQVADLERQLAALRSRLGAEGPGLAAAPAEKLSPVSGGSAPDEGAPVAVLVPRSPSDPPSAWLLPAPRPPTAVLRPPPEVP